MIETAQLRLGETTIELPVEHGTAGQSVVNVGKLLSGAGVTTLDYGYANTASTRSAITFLDGDAGVLRYRGYPIEQLAERSTFLEVAYLLIHGELPTPAELGRWTDDVRRHTLLHEEFKRIFDGFPKDAHPMAILASAVAALSTFYQAGLGPTIPPRSSSRRSACWPSCRRSPRSPTRSRSASRSSIRTTASTTSRTSCG